MKFQRTQVWVRGNQKDGIFHQRVGIFKILYLQNGRHGFVRQGIAKFKLFVKPYLQHAQIRI